MQRTDSPTGQASRDLLSVSERQSCGDGHLGMGLIPPALRMNSATDVAWKPIALAIIDALAPSPYRPHTSAFSASVMFLATCH